MNKKLTLEEFETYEETSSLDSMTDLEIEKNAELIESYESTECYRSDNYTGTIAPGIYRGNSVDIKEIVTICPKDYKIFAIDFKTSFPARISIKKLEGKPWVWLICIANLHGQGRPNGTYRIKVFSKKA